MDGIARKRGSVYIPWNFYFGMAAGGGLYLTYNDVIRRSA